METPTIFGQRLKEMRESLHLTQEDLAIKLGTTKQTISRYEKDQHEPEYETLKKIAITLNTTTDYLLGLTDNPKPLPKE